VSGVPSNATLVLDRDGTVVVDHGYLEDPDRLQFLPGAAEGLRLFSERGARIVIVTNQSGVGRGRFSLGRLHEIHGRLVHMINGIGARVEGIYFCPHRPQDDCACRKPKTKLVLDAAAELGFDPSNVIVIGDKSSDIELGRRLHAVTLLVSGNGAASDGAAVGADFVVHDLLEAARLIGSPSFGTRRSADTNPTL
jgi:D-glycero-D-manno-heptose 1,7-bisphosphate phosphatase